MNRKQMLDHIKAQDMEIFDLIAKVIEVINIHDGWGSECMYRFKSGEVWSRFDPEHDLAKNTGKLPEEDNE